MASVQKSAFLFLSLLIFLKNCVQCPNEDELQASVTVQEQRAFIKISVLLNKAATEIHKESETALGNRAYSLRRVRELAHEYQTRQRLSCEDLPRSGRPVTADTPENRRDYRHLWLKSGHGELMTLLMNWNSVTGLYGTVESFNS